MSNASLIANTQTMLDSGSRFSNTDIARVLSALMVAESELMVTQAAIQRVLNLIGDIGPEARRILTQLPADSLEAAKAAAWDEGARFVLDTGWVDGDDAPPNPYRT